jgi:hypothetical protein
MQVGCWSPRAHEAARLFTVTADVELVASRVFRFDHLDGLTVSVRANTWLTHGIRSQSDFAT